jgi:hypothetical protein
MAEEKVHISNELQPDYEKAELDLLRDALRRSHKERFLFLMALVKMQATMQRAKITHRPFQKP